MEHCHSFKTITLLTIVGLLLFTLSISDSFAKNSSGGFGGLRSKSWGSSFSNESSGGFSSSKSASKAKPSTSKATTSKLSLAQKAASKKEASIYALKVVSNKDHAAMKKIDTKSLAYSKMETQMDSSVGKSGKIYTSKAEAKKDMTAELASNRYFTQPSSRPEHIPATRSVGGNTYNTVYVDGYYGYRGTGGIFSPYGATNMLVTLSMLHYWGYQPAYYQMPVTRTPVVVERNTGKAVILTIFWLFVIGLVIGGCVFAYSKAEA